MAAKRIRSRRVFLAQAAGGDGRTYDCPIAVGRGGRKRGSSQEPQAGCGGQSCWRR